MNKRLAIIALVLTIGIGSFFVMRSKNPQPEPDQKITTTKTSPEKQPDTKASSTTPTTPSALTLPLSDALSRVTKKPFGILIEKKTSPVQPERFAGYHTGVDFETLPEEQDIDVPVHAICTGPLIAKKRATGYGGIAIQRCVIADETVTVIYGHLRLSSITAKLNENISAGTEFAILGKGFSAETDGERKHLHLSIHRGKDVNVLGYVQNASSLEAWLDALTLITP
ncbi:MAG: M23 family metallopeptidase [Candidatus Uhrbacteria bacterium]|nr:M23 family metallopeptidase [Candidatus Uhrbacteria bacterium]